MEIPREGRYNGNRKPPPSGNCYGKKWMVLKMGEENREVDSLHTLACGEDAGPLWVTYKLLDKGGRYGVLCYLEGMDPKNTPRASSSVEDYCGSRDKAEHLLRKLAGGAVLPVHLQDVVWEM